jgi:hypothetical protein
LITADDAGWIKKSIDRFIKVNAEEIEREGYEATIKIQGPRESTKWMNISLDNLKRIMKAVR